MTDFTPGPWDRVETTVFRLDETETCNRFAAQIQGGYKERGQGWSKDERTSDEELLANAHLIAAAPELYEALESAKEWLEQCRGAGVFVHPQVIPDCEAALAKARGEASQ